MIEREALIERLRDAFEDQGLYAPAPEVVEGVYEDAVEPLRLQLEGLATALERLSKPVSLKTEEATLHAMEVEQIASAALAALEVAS